MSPAIRFRLSSRSCDKNGDFAWSASSHGLRHRLILRCLSDDAVSTPFPRATADGQLASGMSGDRFPSPAFISACQALASCIAAGSYLSIKRWAAARNLAEANGSAAKSRPEDSVKSPSPRGVWADWCHLVGWDLLFSSSPAPGQRSLLSLLLRASLCQTCAGPIGFAALRRISYPMMVLGKSCKLLPVLALNVLVYKRSFARYKYLVVALVSAGIAGFVLGADAGRSKARTKTSTNSDSWIGLGLLAVK